MMMPSNIIKRSVAQICILIVLSLTAWNVLHKTPFVPNDVYPYLTSISPELVKQCIEENNFLPQINFEDLLAIRSTISSNRAQLLLNQFEQNITYSDLDWGVISKNEQQTIQKRREILRKYQFYHPYKYVFPVPGSTWFEDSFGADREGGKRRHEGTDLFGKEGISIVSVCGGTIEQLGWNRLGGERVGVRGDDGNYYYYAHLQSISPSLVKGKRIEGGVLIGTMGHTGDALTTPDHLHFGIEIPNGQWINPYPFLVAWQSWKDVTSSSLP